MGDQFDETRPPGPWADGYVYPNDAGVPPLLAAPPEETHDPVVPVGAEANQARQQLFSNYADPKVNPKRPRPLLASDYKNVEELKRDLNIETTREPGRNYVEVWQGEGKRHQVSNFLSTETFSQEEVADASRDARRGDPRAALRLNDRDSGQARQLWNDRERLERIRQLSYKDRDKKGNVIKDDVAFQTIALDMISNMTGSEQLTLAERKAYESMFLHILGQAVTTMQFDQRLADQTGDMHERAEGSVITGEIGDSQKEQEDGVDAYVDLINNAHGQKLGAKLRRQQGLPSTWSPEQTAKFFNSVQAEIAAQRGLEFKSFAKDDAHATRFAEKLKRLGGDQQLVEDLK
jgi:hypothetical protein